jgi:hypothetical protein
MTSQERARAFLQMLGELSASLESHLADDRRKRESVASDRLRAVPDLDEEVDDDSAE